ncbi:MAG: hypothetical protein ABFS35_01910 [Bacteroidota bacterium]
MQLKRLAFISFLFLLACGLYAQEPLRGPNVYVSPRINIGYTFGAGITYGFDVVVGAYSTKNFNFGLAYSHYFVNVPKDFHRFKTISLVIENSMFNAKFGAGMVSRKWGLRNVNTAKVHGMSIDISAGVDEYHAPWVGVKSFIQNRKRWTFFDYPSYISIYTYFKTPEIEIYDQRMPL